MVLLWGPWKCTRKLIGLGSLKPFCGDNCNAAVIHNVEKFSSGFPDAVGCGSAPASRA